MGEQRQVELSIETLTHGGRGLGFCDGKAVFVPLTAPGDRVLARVCQEKKRYCSAELIEILEPSDLRQTPPCPRFGDCGGCQWQHLSYQQQLAWKERIYFDLLGRSGLATNGQLQAIMPAPQQFHYRNRVQFKCRMTADGFVIGFYRAGQHFVVDTECCLLLMPAVQRILTLLRCTMERAPRPDAVPQVDVTCGDDDAVQLVVHLLPDAVMAMRPWLQDLARQHDLTLSLQVGRKDSLRRIHGGSDQVLNLPSSGVSLRVRAGGFAQINPQQNRVLVETVCRLAGLNGSERVLDLFCGAGNFSLPLARNARWVDGVEAFAPAIEDACHNAVANGIDNVAFHAEDATEAIARLWTKEDYDLVVLDPPRSGCYAVIGELVRRRPARIIYVSCDPATLARDLHPLMGGGYRLVVSQPCDMFPQTWHVESVCLLQRS
ncbi:MAG: 23S rRNA (uracil(1939)-C(5))-methyltransferase RlmD [Desulfuromonas sp.]|nr:MAG: 23S rRNA (uracil(1939)-C(5))-methyltransferase RlmD [Desulfuromonas sp.]